MRRSNKLWSLLGYDQDTNETATTPHAAIANPQNTPSPPSSLRLEVPPLSPRQQAFYGSSPTEELLVSPRGERAHKSVEELEAENSKLKKMYKYIQNANKSKDEEIIELQGRVAKLEEKERKRLQLKKKYAQLSAEMADMKKGYDSSIEELQQRITQLNNSVFLLRQDRQILEDEVYEGRGKVETLQTSIEEMRTYQSQLEETLDNLRQELLKLSHTELNARKFAANSRSLQDAHSDAAFRSRFHLPTTEFVVTSFYCCYKYIYHGWLYITPSYVCYEPVMLGGDSSRIVFPIDSISAIHLARLFYYIPVGTNTGLEFVLKSGAKYFFANFVNRETVVANLLAQARNIGHFISVDLPPQVLGQIAKQITSTIGTSPNGTPKIRIDAGTGTASSGFLTQRRGLVASEEDYAQPLLPSRDKEKEKEKEKKSADKPFWEHEDTHGYLLALPKEQEYTKESNNNTSSVNGPKRKLTM